MKKELKINKKLQVKKVKQPQNSKKKIPSGKSLDLNLSKHIKKTDDELKEIAKDLWAGKIFSDRHITSLKDSPNMLGMVFMPIVFMDSETKKQLSDFKVNFIYEYLDKAGPRAINGMPTFFSCRTLTEPETKKMFEYYEKFKELAGTL